MSHNIHNFLTILSFQEYNEVTYNGRNIKTRKYTGIRGGGGKIKTNFKKIS